MILELSMTNNNIVSLERLEIKCIMQYFWKFSLTY